MELARYWTAQDGKVACKLCYRHCIIAEGKTGVCWVRTT